MAENYIDPEKNFNELQERSQLLDDYDRNFDEARQTTKLATIFSGFAAILLLTSGVLFWILFHRDRNSVILAHAILITIGFVFAAIAAVWSLGANKQVLQNKQPNPNLTALIFIGSLLFCGYFLASTAYIYLYRNFNHSQYVCTLSDKGYNAQDSETRLRQNQRFIWWTCLFTFITTFCFAYVAYAAWSSVVNHYELARISSFIFTIAAVTFGFLILYWSEVSTGYQRYEALAGKFDGTLIRTIFVFALLSIILATLNAIINLRKYRLFYFIFGIVLLLLTILTLCAGGSFLRQYRQNHDLQAWQSNCSNSLYPIKHDDLSYFCPRKYLDTDQTCRKSDLVNRWEDPTNTKVYSLNPAACLAAGNFYLYPYFLLGLYTLLLIISLAYIVGFNFFLSDSSTSLNNVDVHNSGITYALFAIPLLVILGFSLYYIFRPTTPIIPSGNPDIEALRNFNLNGFTAVNLPSAGSSIDTDVPQLTNPCFDYDFNRFPSLNFTGQKAGSIQRAALLVRNAEVKIGERAGAQIGHPDSRSTFFFDDHNSADAYVLLFGSDISIAVDNLQICPNNLAEDVKILANFNLVEDGSTLTNDGISLAERKAVQDPSSTGPRSTPEWTAFTTRCTANCTVEYNTGTAGTPNRFELQIQVEDVNGKWVNAEVSDIQVTAKTLGRQLNVLQGSNTDGKRVFHLNSLSGQCYAGELDVKDVRASTKRYLDYAQQFLVCDQAQTNLGQIRLSTFEGKGCAADANEATCWASQKQATSSVSFVLLNSDNQSPLPNTQVRLQQTFSSNGQQYNTYNTDSKGRFQVANLPYNSYRVSVADDSDNYPSVSFNTINTATADVNLFAQGKVAGQSPVMRILFGWENTNLDLDLVLKVQAKNGSECTVSSGNRYCAFARLVRDRQVGESGDEIIQVEKFTVAHYLVYVRPAPTYSGQCESLNVLLASNNVRVLAQASTTGFNFESLRGENPISQAGIAIVNNLNSGFSKIKKAVASPIEYTTTQAYNSLCKDVNDESFAIWKAACNNLKKANPNIDAASAASAAPAAPAPAAPATRVLGAGQLDYFVKQCFTGFGNPSVIEINQFRDSEPAIKECVDRFPDGSQYSLTKLEERIKAK